MMWTQVLILIVLLFGAPLHAQEAADPSRAITALDPTVTPQNLGLLAMPLTQSELKDEIAAWQKRLQAVVTELNAVQIQLNKIHTIETAREAGAELPEHALVGLEADVSDKEKLAEEAGDLLAKKGALQDRFKVIVDAYEEKGGDPAEYRTFAKAVSGVQVNWTDPHSAWKTISGWATSKEGGIKLGLRIAAFAGVLLAAWIVGALVSWILAAGFRFTGTGSKLLRRFVVRWSRRVIFFIGAMIGLSALGVNVTPLLAAFGAAGFVIGLALQGTLSNFASGLLIMTQRPFDVGDSVEAAGVSGTVDQVSLFNTHLITPDNKHIVVPNNSIWGGTITNATASEQRRLDMQVEIDASVGTEEAEKKLASLVAGHEKVVHEPAPSVRFDSYLPGEGESGASKRFAINFWAKTGDLSDIRWDLIHAMEREFGTGALQKVA
jgi:small conductance mechanosensitive channel